MFVFTPHQARYFAEQIALKRSESTIDGLVSAMSGVKVDLNPHQVDAALFAMQSPLSSGAVLADEVGLGKTIEAGLVIAQYWSERKRHILLIVPASLRTQWRSELSEKFYIDSVIMDADSFNNAKKGGQNNPFVSNDKVIICSYHFAAKRIAELRQVTWDLVVMDEAHKLRNAYKKDNVIGNKLKTLENVRKKLLLTATPLQNDLMELYGLTSVIDEHIFGDPKAFKNRYMSEDADSVNENYCALRDRLQNFCKRTLRSQVTEYVKYTNRIAILQEYTPTDDEEQLYNGISEYLQRKKLYALPSSQRKLMTMILRKLLASSSFAISGTLDVLIERLEKYIEGITTQLDFTDFDVKSEYEDEEEDLDETADVILDREAAKEELEILRGFSALAKSITFNAKGDNLLTALEKGFAKIAELGGQKKAVIFTESKRTQDYLNNLLSNHGYEGKIVFLNGENKDDVSKEIYKAWKERHKYDGLVSGSKEADVKTAIVEAFKNDASILIGTEAASEGINLQFCSMIVNYDLPWNPQRIEQRIGRCHRYGQKNDVVVINFLNNCNEADKRVYELLDEKLKLFSGIFGASDEVLGAIESGMDFEKRIAEIYQKCRTKDEIEREFNELQAELEEQITAKMTDARKSILENFDEEVANRLENCQKNTVASLDKFNQWMVYLLLVHGAERVEPSDMLRFKCADDQGTIKIFNLRWKDAEELGDFFLRRDDPLVQKWLQEALEVELQPAVLRFDNSGSTRHLSFFDAHQGLKGMLSVDKFVYTTDSDMDERIVFTVKTEDGTELDDVLINNMMELPAEISGCCLAVPAEFTALQKQNIERQREHAEKLNQQYYLDECNRLDAYYEDLKEGLEREIKALDKAIKEKKKLLKSSAADKSFSEIVAIKDEQKKLEAQRNRMRRELYEKQDKLDAENDRVQEDIRKKLTGTFTVEPIMTIGFEIV